MLNSFGIIEAVGLFGGFILLLAYFLLQAGRLRGSDNRYALMVMAGNILLLLSVFKTLVPGAAMVQATFVMISVYGITRRALKARELRFQPMERALMARVLPDMPPVHARRLLDLGEWSLASPGSRLTEEGEPVRNLIYLDTAAATVTVGGMVVARLESALVGDINAVAGGPASATVAVDRQGWIFVVSGKALAAQIARDSEFRICVELALSRELARKLQDANAAHLARAQSG